MNKYYEPNCELPWDVYLDWLADQGFDELRHVDVCSLISGCFFDNSCHMVILNYPCQGYGQGAYSYESDVNHRGDGNSIIISYDFILRRLAAGDGTYQRNYNQLLSGCG